jgi:hypothetical protein
MGTLSGSQSIIMIALLGVTLIQTTRNGGRVIIANILVVVGVLFFRLCSSSLFLVFWRKVICVSCQRDGCPRLGGSARRNQHPHGPGRGPQTLTAARKT